MKRKTSTCDFAACMERFFGIRAKKMWAPRGRPHPFTYKSPLMKSQEIGYNEATSTNKDKIIGFGGFHRSVVG